MKSVVNITRDHKLYVRASAGSNLFRAALETRPTVTLGPKGMPLPELKGWHLQITQVLHAHTILVQWKAAVELLKAKQYDIHHWARSIQDAEQRLQERLHDLNLTTSNIEKRLSM